MAFVAGKSLKLSIFGSSHGDLVGCSLDGLPAGLKIDEDNIRKWLSRRRPSQSEYTTQRKEKDVAEIVSGMTDGYTDGGPVTILIRNEDRISAHYEEMRFKPRPGHGDLTLFYKYGEHRNYKGGGFLSGRMTAPLVAAGAITTQLLDRYGVTVSSYIEKIGDARTSMTENDVGPDFAYEYKTRMPDADSDAIADGILKALLKDGDSIGGSIKTVVRSPPRGIGEPFYDSVESSLSRMMFSIPGLKGIEFGAGFRFSGLKGSEANDVYFLENGDVKTRSNNNGGILGGITNGMPIVFSVVMKPTSSIRKEQSTVNLKTWKEDALRIVGRHDPCIAIRAVPVVQTLTSVAIADLMLQNQNIPRVLDDGEE
ncbi:chorismate synthase [uncultured archaeon]|nr:chorismate synthase [uncultured archaeon]